MKIGLDYDSVITDSRRIKARLARERFGLDIPYQMFKWDTAVVGGLLTPEQYRVVQGDVHNSERYNCGAPEVTDAVRTIRTLAGQGHELRVVTLRDGTAARHAREWLANRQLRLPLTGVGHGKSKREATTGLDIFVDDDLDKLEDLTVPHRFLFTWEYNLHKRLPEGIRRVYSWRDLYEKIGKVQDGTR